MIQVRTERLLLRVPAETDADKLFLYFQKNRNYLKRWFVTQPEKFYEYDSIQQHLSLCLSRAKTETEIRFFLHHKDSTDILIGELTFSNIIKGGFLSCYAGYHIDETMQGKGYMTEALTAGVDYMFRKVKLHRIEANIMPANIASQRVAVKSGFYKEGISAKYLNINGSWEDHLRYVTFNPSME